MNMEERLSLAEGDIEFLKKNIASLETYIAELDNRVSDLEPEVGAE